ncbi:MAG: hypothetical protein AAFW73_12015 [Bacteroidota bacterium]
MNRLKLGLLGSLFILSSSCARIYYTTDARSLAIKHQQIAVLPAQVSIAASKSVEASVLERLEMIESLNLQRALHAWLLKRKGKGRIEVELLELDEVNAVLTRANYFTDPDLSSQEICRLLGVDALLRSKFDLSRPLSGGASRALQLTLGGLIKTKSVTAQLDIYDGGTERFIWGYRGTLSGSSRTTHLSLIQGLMRSASRHLPHKVKKRKKK